VVDCQGDSNRVRKYPDVSPRTLSVGHSILGSTKNKKPSDGWPFVLWWWTVDHVPTVTSPLTSPPPRQLSEQATKDGVADGSRTRCSSHPSRTAARANRWPPSPSEFSGCLMTVSRKKLRWTPGAYARAPTITIGGDHLHRHNHHGRWPGVTVVTVAAYCLHRRTRRYARRSDRHTSSGSCIHAGMSRWPCSTRQTSMWPGRST
jgi:hypothetical protein